MGEGLVFRGGPGGVASCIAVLFVGGVVKKRRFSEYSSRSSLVA